MLDEARVHQNGHRSGDGDCGLTLQTGAQGLRSHGIFNVGLHVLFAYPAVLARPRAGSITGPDVVCTLIAVSEVVPEKMGGPAVHFTREFPFHTLYDYSY